MKVQALPSTEIRPCLWRFSAIIHLMLWLGCGFAIPASARFVVYPKPPGLSANDAAQPSTEYAVTVMQGDEARPSFVYEIHADKKQSWRHNVCSFTTFSFADSVTVEVRRLSGPKIESCNIHPVSAAIQAVKVDEQTVRFKLDRPNRKLAVIFYDDWSTHPLLVFGEELEQELPEHGGPDVIYFGPGVHTPGRIRVRSGETLYLAGGAYVKGHVDEVDLQSVKVLGRGVLSAELLGGGGRKGINTIDVQGDATADLRVEGVTFIQSAHFACRLRGSGSLIRNVKVVDRWHPRVDRGLFSEVR